MADPFQEMEDRDGVRWNWNAYPSPKEHAQHMVLPLSLLYTPLKAKSSTLPLLETEPVLCKGCKAILNPSCRVDWTSRLWVCPFCLTRNALPPHYAGVNPQNPASYPRELYPQNTIIEYLIKRPPTGNPVYFFCIDTCMQTDELESLKDSILQSLSLLPEDALVGVVTFGAMVTVWEVGFTELHKSYVLGGGKEYSTDQMSDYLQVHFAPGSVPGQRQAAPNGMLGRFIAPLSECELNLTSIIEELTIDPWPTKQDERPMRCTGAALDVSLKMLQLSGLTAGGRLLLFAGGAITKGPGQIVSRDLNENIRSHNDIKTDQSPFFLPACQFYVGLADRLVQAGLACDIFAGCLDQVGITELACCCDRTGGFLLMVDTFKTPVFKTTYQRFFQGEEKDMGSVFSATMEVQTSRGTKVAGIIGPCSSLRKMSSSVSEEEEIGQGKTCAWQMSCLTSRTTFGVYFDMCGGASEGQERYVQFITSYQTPQGLFRLRVATIAHRITPSPEAKYHVGNGIFDQDAAAVLAARHAVDLLEKNNNNVNEVMRWIDRNVIHLVRHFGTYTPNDPSSLKLSSDFTLFPIFMYHLRRSEFLQIFNSSPDETTFFRHTLLRENCSNAIIMIQPTLHSYSFNGPPQAVLLDSNSVMPDNILLLDTFFDVVIHHGMTIAAWYAQNYHEQPEHAAFKQLLLAPKVDAERLMADRFPYPKYTECNQNGSQARIVLNRLNPSVSYTNQQYGQQGQVVLTDDANLQTFMAHLKRLAVTTQA
uniref:Protein transport protein SEC23 n=1 Tax=Eutreptiella gymnastica TaxID=73025 RepID=A0A7S1NFL3_9EUGL|mmetsp:Transcript_30916/g.55524  ORF Transcript_30916/g.55524 Transcript_30916/m.55524 type:complete len:761 (+) Transcript_30916:120-2402(+)